MLGHKLIQCFSDDFKVVFTIRSTFESLKKCHFGDDVNIYEKIDVEEIESVEKVIREVKPNFVINAVGIIKQLKESKNDLLSLNINSIFPRRLAQLSAKYDFKLINISTDCVFKGEKGNYSEEDFADAEDLYGKSKYLGEVSSKNCLTIRTSIIGREIFTSHSLVEWFFTNVNKDVNGFTKAVFSGFPTIVLADIIKKIITDFSHLEGLYHVSSEPINKYDLLNLIKDKFNLNINIIPENEFRIDRSLDSTLFRKITGFEPMPWDEMIEIMANDPTPYDKWRNQKF